MISDYDKRVIVTEKVKIGIKIEHKPMGVTVSDFELGLRNSRGIVC